MFITYQRDDGRYNMINVEKITVVSCEEETVVISFNDQSISLSRSEYARLKEECLVRRINDEINVHFPKMGKYILE